MIRARWLDHDVARRLAEFERGGPLVLWAKAWPTGRAATATYGDLVLSEHCMWWFEAGSSDGVLLRGLDVIDVRSGSKRLDRWLNDLSGWALVDLTVASAGAVTVAVPDDQAALLIDAVTGSVGAVPADSRAPAHRAPVAGKPPCGPGSAAWLPRSWWAGTSPRIPGRAPA